MLELPPPGCPRCLAGIMGHALSAAACPVPGRSQENSSLSVSPGSGAGRRGWTASRAADEPGRRLPCGAAAVGTRGR